MTKGLTKFMSMGLVCILVLAVLLTGCGSSTQDTNNEAADAEETVGQDTTDSSDAEVEPEVEEPKYDFGGRTITITQWWDFEPKAGDSEYSDNMVARIADMQEKYNYIQAFSNVPYDQYLEKFTASTLAGDPFGDIVFVEDRWFYPGLVANGFLYPVSDLQAFDFSEEKWNKDYTEGIGVYKDKIYGMEIGRTEPRAGMFWNKSLFEREGLPNLYELQNNKQWTWDKMLEIAKKATKDLDGDGKIDQWGLGGIGTEWSFVYSNNGETVRIEDGKPVFALGEPNAIEALQYFQDIIHVQKVFDVPPDGAPWDYATQQFQDGKVAMHNYQWWIAPVQLIDNMTDDYGFVVFPMGPKADDYICEFSQTNMRVMPATVKNPEEVAVIWDEYTDPFPGDDPDSWREGYQVSVRDSESVDTIGMIQEQHLIKHNPLICFKALEQMSWDFMWQIKTANNTPQVAINAIADQAQSILDDAMKQQ